MRVLVFGSFNLDHIYRVTEFVKPGETKNPLSAETLLGGKGFNQAASAAKAGLEVYAAGNIGADGECFLRKCAELGIDSHLVSVHDALSGNAVIQVNDHGENCILLYGGTNRIVSREQVRAVLGEFAPGDVIILQNEINELAYIIDEARARGMRVALNPSPMDASITAEMIAKADWLFVNETEAEQLCHESDPTLALRKLSELCPEGHIILTLGADGSCYRDAAQELRQKAVSSVVVDTTGAGDTFTGYFLAAVLSGKGAQEALLTASKASAIAVSRKGACDSIPGRDEIE